MSAIVSPATALGSQSMGLSGTDIQAHRSFEEAAEQYRQDMVRALNKDIALHRDPSLPAHRMETDYLRGRELGESIPPFSHRSPDLLVSLGNHWRSFFMLCAWGIASLTALLLTGRRISVG